MTDLTKRPGARILVDQKGDTPARLDLLRKQFPDAIIVGKVADASLAGPPAVTPGSTGPARTPGDHKTRDRHST